MCQFNLFSYFRYGKNKNGTGEARNRHAGRLAQLESAAMDVSWEGAVCVLSNLSRICLPRCRQASDREGKKKAVHSGKRN